MSTLKGKDLLSLHELTVDEMEEILELAAELKAMQKAGVQHHAHHRVHGSHDHACLYILACELLHAKSLCVRIAAVTA